MNTRVSLFLSKILNLKKLTVHLERSTADALLCYLKSLMSLKQSLMSLKQVKEIEITMHKMDNLGDYCS